MANSAKHLALHFATAGVYGSFVYLWHQSGLFPFESKHHDWPKLATELISYMPDEVQPIAKRISHKVHQITSITQVQVEKELIKTAEEARQRAQEIANEMKHMDANKAMHIGKQLAEEANLFYDAVSEMSHDAVNAADKIHHELSSLDTQFLDNIGRLDEIGAEILDEIKEVGIELEAIVMHDANDVASDAEQDLQYCMYHADKLAKKMSKELNVIAEKMWHQAQQDADQLTTQVTNEAKAIGAELWNKAFELDKKIYSSREEVKVVTKKMASNYKAAGIKFVLEAYTTTKKVSIETSQSVARFLVSSLAQLKAAAVLKATKVKNSNTVVQLMHTITSAYNASTQYVIDLAHDTASRVSNSPVGIFAKTVPVAVRNVSEEAVEISTDLKMSIEETIHTAKTNISQDIKDGIPIVKHSAIVGKTIVIEVAKELINRAENAVAIVAQAVVDTPERLEQTTVYMASIMDPRKIRSDIQVAVDYVVQTTVRPAVDRIANKAKKSKQELTEQVTQTAKEAYKMVYHQVAQVAEKAYVEVAEQVNQTSEIIIDLLLDVAMIESTVPEKIHEATSQLVMAVPQAVDNVTWEAKQIASDLVQTPKVQTIITNSQRAASATAELAKEADRLAEKFVHNLSDATVKVSNAAVQEVAGPIANSISSILSLPATAVITLSERVIDTVIAPSELEPPTLADPEVATEDMAEEESENTWWPVDWDDSTFDEWTNSAIDDLQLGLLEIVDDELPLDTVLSEWPQHSSIQDNIEEESSISQHK